MKYTRRIICLLLIIVTIAVFCSSALATENSDFTVVNGVLTKYSGNGGDVVIPSNMRITEIGQCVFLNNEDIKSVVIPSQVVTIGSNAFAFCKNLRSVTIPDSVTEIENEAFFDCESLKSINIPDSAISIGSSVFALTGITSPVLANNGKILCHVPNTSSYTIPNTVITICGEAFFSCASLKTLVIPSNVTTVGTAAFRGTSISEPLYIDSRKTLCYVPKTLTNFSIPKSVTKINGGAFKSCTCLGSVTIPDSVRSIGEYAFMHCNDLTMLAIPSSITSIGDGAFVNCSSLMTITIPAGVPSISIGSFARCGSLASMTVLGYDTLIASDPFYRPDHLTIYGLPGSAAQTYADDNNITFKSEKTAVPTKSSVFVNGGNVAFEAYNIDGYTYFKLRDLAMVLNGTAKQFNVGWDGAHKAISLIPSTAYTPVGGELTVSGNTDKKSAAISSARVYMNDSEVLVEAYNINNNNYFKLRDIAAIINFGVTWNEKARSIEIVTTTGYTA